MTSRNRLGETRLILIGAAVLLSLGMGIRQSFGLFLTPVTRAPADLSGDLRAGKSVDYRVSNSSPSWPAGTIG